MSFLQFATPSKCTRQTFSFLSRRHDSSKRSLSVTSKVENHYETLGVPPEASRAQIKSNFYRLSKEHHPDVAKGPGSEAVFRAASEAYSVLSDDRQRRAYDRKLQQARAAAAAAAQPTAPRPSRVYTYSEWQVKRRNTVHYAWEFSSRPNSSQQHRSPPPGWTSPRQHHPAGHSHPQSHGGHYTRPGQRPQTHAQQQAHMERQRAAQAERTQLEGVSTMSRAGAVVLTLILVAVTGGILAQLRGEMRRPLEREKSKIKSTLPDGSPSKSIPSS
ncbi:hypothetical protein EYR38_003655 [Pleurotus pulmonarius]|nr:hypothetical protein EYR38_003655 [Pleurotus pulmonarius]